MVVRMAAALSLVSFALCLLIGVVETGNSFGTIVRRALLAMAGTLVIGLVVGAAFKAMLNENLKDEVSRLKTPPGTPAEGEAAVSEVKRAA